MTSYGNVRLRCLNLRREIKRIYKKLPPLTPKNVTFLTVLALFTAFIFVPVNSALAPIEDNYANDKNIVLDSEISLQHKDPNLPIIIEAEPTLPAPVRSNHGLIKPNAERWRSLVEAHFPASQVNNALIVMSCESGGNPESINWGDAKITGYPSAGLFQINRPLNWEWSDPTQNVVLAADYYNRRGWQPWTCAKKYGIV